VTTTLDRAKHRAPRRSPISSLALTASTHNARRGVLIAASSGIVLTMVATTASAAPEGQDLAIAEAGATTLTDTALAALSLSPSVKVDATAGLELPEMTASSKPAPEPEPVRVATTTTSRTSTRTATAATYTEVPASGLGATIVAIAKQYVGVPYVYGGATPAGFDCSGFTSYVYAQVGISLPRSSAGQHALGNVVSAANAMPGDLMTWDGHVGIYLGGGMHIAARNPGTPLSISPIYRDGARYHRFG
jgi:cell wall-associated NlpC family hydrolase